MKYFAKTSANRLAIGSATLALLLSGCAANEPDPTLDRAIPKGDQIAGRDDPSGLLENAERRLAQLISDNDVGQDFGVPDELVPYPDTYWPMVDNGIAVEWLEKSGGECVDPNECQDPQPSPLAKFVGLTNPDAIQDAIDWEVEHHGKDVPDVADWFGHCPGWVASASLYAPIQGPVSVRSNGLSLEACEAGSEGCTTFEIGDVNALMAEAHEGARARFIGARCDTEPDDIERDEHGRIVRKGKGCQGLNAGAMLIVMGNQLKMNHKPFAIDAQNDFNTEQIWNQPAFRYTVHGFRTLTEAQAANLVASGGESTEGEVNEYQWNSNAKGFAHVEVTLHWVAETSGPNTSVVSGLSTSRETTMSAVIELDRDAADPEATIIGGEYLDDPSIGASRLKVAPFAWLAIDMGPDFRHNPHVKGNLVKELIALASPETPSNDCHDVCEEGAALAASCGTCAAAVGTADPFCTESGWDRLCVGQVAELCEQTCN